MSIGFAASEIKERFFFPRLDNLFVITYNNGMVMKIYQDKYGNQPFIIWLESIKDKITQLRIRKRLRRIEQGNLGDYRSVGEGVLELRLHFGPGYRVYCSQISDEIVLLLAGGDKSTQERDIQRAKSYLDDYRWSQK
jgi:putative addiction module killer protein